MKRRSFLKTAAMGATVTGLARTATAQASRRPNILWLTCEDNNVDWVGCYGNPHAETPNIDQLAAEGFQYMHAYASAPVCAPQRSTWITGINALSMGTHPMRSRNNIPHNLIQYYPDHLKANGYYVGNYKKTDYNIGGRSDNDCWDRSGKVDWNKLKQNQPFFQIINEIESHESRAQGNVENTQHDPANTKLRAYHPDLPDVRKNYAKYHDAVKRMDSAIGVSLAKLEELGLAENTIVIHNSDHGGVLPRSKRYLFESGLHCPLIIRIPERFKHLWPAEKPGTQVDRLVSFVDMPKTWLSLTGSNVPDYMQGNIFLGKQTEPEKEFHFAFRGRMDERCENARAVCDKEFLYIRNYMPYAPWMQHLDYLWKMKATVAWDNHVKSGKASEVEARFFAPKGWTEELYDMRKDPDNINNLANHPEYRAVAARMKAGLRTWQEQVYDAGLLPESDMVKRAADNNMTIYEMVRDPKLYNLPALINAADIALTKSSMTFPMLMNMIKDPDSGIRYWGVVGCFQVNVKPNGIHALLEDESHEVRAMAAWLLVKTGEKEQGLKCLEVLLKENSYASLKVLNIIDWMGDDGKVLMPVVDSLKLKDYEARMQNNLLLKFGMAPKPSPKKKKKK
jgi:arylsulfatase A-like enzyme